MVIRRCSGSFRAVSLNRAFCYKLSVFVLTYVAYTSYHLSRKSLSVVKSVLHPDHVPNGTRVSAWAPFDDLHGPALLGILDSAFLFAYAIGMFFSGMLAERFNLRYYLTLGMLGSGMCAVLFGLAHRCQIHSFTYFVCVQVASGVFQTTGWPAVIAVMANWFGTGKKGLIFGIWNSHTSLGNILGSLIAGMYVKSDWALSFIYPGLIVGVAGFVIWLFLVPDPADVNLVVQNVGGVDVQTEHCDSDEDVEDDSAPILGAPSSNEANISFMRALRIPGVIEYSLSLFFAKLVSYTFLFWLPLYINASTKLDASKSAYVSAMFDVGGAMGGIVAGIIRDCGNMPALTCCLMLLISIPLMYFYEIFGSYNFAVNLSMLFLVGFFINGPYALITTTISTDLANGRSVSRRDNRSEKCMATVCAIIDGTGSVGATLGPFLTGFLSSNWSNVFWMLIASNLLSVLFLGRILKRECSRLWIR